MKLSERGRALEHYLDEICNQLNDMGFHAHKNYSRRTYEGIYLSGEPFDYEIFAHGKVHCFDAKENMSGINHWHLTGSKSIMNKLMRQAINLAHCEAHGADSYFLVYFGNDKSEICGKLIRFDASIIYNALLTREKKIHYSSGTFWDINDILRR